jgi:hypothetical protein
MYFCCFNHLPSEVCSEIEKMGDISKSVLLALFLDRINEFIVSEGLNCSDEGTGSTVVLIASL